MRLTSFLSARASSGIEAGAMTPGCATNVGLAAQAACVAQMHAIKSARRIKPAAKCARETMIFPYRPGWPGGETVWARSGGTSAGTFVPCVTGRFLSRSSRVAGES
jgi:hypothetical protein